MSNTIEASFLHIPISLPPLIWCPNLYQPLSISTNRYISLLIGAVIFSASYNSRFTPHSIDDILRPDPQSLERNEFKPIESPLNLSLSKGNKDTIHCLMSDKSSVKLLRIKKSPSNSPLKSHFRSPLKT